MAVQHDPVREFTFLSITIGILVAVVMTAANIYLALYAGLTVSASIPAAVIAAAIFRTFSIKNSLHQSNIVQTMASAGETLAAGIVFTLPALVIVGAWQKFEFMPTTIIAICGGLLGVIFMIPLRRALITNNKELIYPEGVACAKVLQTAATDTQDTAGIKAIVIGVLTGGLFKVFSGGFKWFVGTFESAIILSKRTFFFGLDLSPALLGVGYIVNLKVASLVMLGGAIGWFVGLPMLLVTDQLSSLSATEIAWTLWSEKIRYLGVGAMLVGGVFSIISVRSGIADGMKELQSSYRNRHNKDVSRTEKDMSIMAMFTIFICCFFAMIWLYHTLLNHLGLSIFTAAIMILASFPFVAVSSYIVGLVGTSNNPVSGITISVLIATSALFLLLGWKGDSAILATLGVSAIVCCAACTAGDCSQDLKTGAIIQSTPKYQQWAQCIGVLIPAFTIAPVLTVLHEAYGIGTGLRAPQATLFASITDGLFGQGNLPITILLYGIGLGATILILDKILQARHSNIRLHLMPVAVGIYLPLTLSVPIFLGGLIRYVISHKRSSYKEENDNGVLLSSGLIAGEAVVGVILAAFIYNNIDLSWPLLNKNSTEMISLLAFFLLAFVLYRSGKQKKSA